MTVSELECAHQILEVGPRLGRWIAALLRRQTELASFTVPQFRVLHYVQHHGPCPQSDVAHWRSVAAATMSRTVETLVEKGFLERQGSREDRRRVFLQLTPAGERFLAGVYACMERAVAAELAGTSEAQRAIISAGLAELGALLGSVGGTEAEQP